MPRPNAKRKTLNVKRLYLPHVSAQGNNICVNLGYQCSKIKPRISRISRIRLRPHGFHEATFVQFVIFVVHKIVHLEIRVICAIRGSLNVLRYTCYVYVKPRIAQIARMRWWTFFSNTNSTNDTNLASWKPWGRSFIREIREIRGFYISNTDSTNLHRYCFLERKRGERMNVLR